MSRRPEKPGYVKVLWVVEGGRIVSGCYSNNQCCRQEFLHWHCIRGVSFALQEILRESLRVLRSECPGVEVHGYEEKEKYLHNNRDYTAKDGSIARVLSVVKVNTLA